MIGDAIGALGEGVRRWQADATVQVTLLRSVAGRDGREVPDLPVQQLARDLRRAASGGVPAPLPVPAAVSPPSPLDEKQDEGSGAVVFEEIG